MPQPTERPSLTPGQRMKLALIGAFYWFAAALIVRTTAAGWVGSDAMTALVFALIVPGTVVALVLGYRLAGIRRDYAAAGATIITGMAALLDGLALTWLPSLYGPTPALVLGGAAAILWGAGVALALGMMLEHRAK